MRFLMVVVLLLSGIVSGTVAGLIFWIAGYNIGAIALSYWVAGSTAVIFAVLIQVIFQKFLCINSLSHNEIKLIRRPPSTRP